MKWMINKLIHWGFIQSIWLCKLYENDYFFISIYHKQMIIDMFMIIIKLENLRKNIETTKDEETIHKLTIVVISILLHSHKVTTLFFFQNPQKHAQEEKIKVSLQNPLLQNLIWVVINTNRPQHWSSYHSHGQMTTTMIRWPHGHGGCGRVHISFRLKFFLTFFHSRALEHLSYTNED